MDGEQRQVSFRVIAGSARSGTTWLLDALAEANGLRTVFEPLHPKGVPGARDFSRRYIRPDTEDAALHDLLYRSLTGQIRGIWPSYRVLAEDLRSWNDPKAVIYYSWALLSRAIRSWRIRQGLPLTKFIRGNLMLGWIQKHFGARTVLLLRHPGAVVASRLRLNPTAWTSPETQLTKYLSDRALVEDHIEPVRRLLEAPLSPTELHAAVWCIENLVPMRQARQYKIQVLHYERLVLGVDAEWRLALQSLGLRNRPGDVFLSRPSQQVSEEMKRRSFDARHISRWIQKLEPKDRHRIQRILGLFGITRYRMDDPMPAPSS